jgi:hypothetical protein
MLTTDPNDPDLNVTEGSGMKKKYLVLSDEERKKGFVRPVRRGYIHVGIRPKHPLLDLTPEQHERYDQYGYIKFVEYPKSSEGGETGRYWTKEELESGCQTLTTMGQALAETYARDPKFYGATFCCHCGKHLRVGPEEMGGQFVWDGTTERVGT